MTKIEMQAEAEAPSVHDHWVSAIVRFEMIDVPDDECPYDTAEERLYQLFASYPDRNIDFEWLEGIEDGCEDCEEEGDS